MQFEAEVLESQNLRRGAVVAWERLIRYEGGYRGWWGLVSGNPIQGFSQAGFVALPVGGAAEFRVPEEPERTDFFATIQTGQTELSSN